MTLHSARESTEKLFIHLKMNSSSKNSSKNEHKNRGNNKQSPQTQNKTLHIALVPLFPTEML